MQFASSRGLWQRLANNKSSRVKRVFLTATSFFICFSFSFRFASTGQRYCFKHLPRKFVSTLFRCAFNIYLVSLIRQPKFSPDLDFEALHFFTTR